MRSSEREAAIVVVGGAGVVESVLASGSAPADFPVSTLEWNALLSGRALAPGEAFTLDAPQCLARVVGDGDRKLVVITLSDDIVSSQSRVSVVESANVEVLLHEAYQRLELAVSAGNLGLWDWDTKESVYFSPGWKAQLGFTDPELPNTLEAWRALIHPADRGPVFDVVNAHVANTSLPARFVNEFRMRTKDGTHRWVAGFGQVVRDAEGRCVRVVGYHVDVNERRTRDDAEAKLRSQLQRTVADLARASKLKDQFLANMSHELRTPLNAIIGQSEVLLEELHGTINAAQRHALGLVSTSSEHLLALINDLLDVAKVDAGRLELERQPTSLDHLCQECVGLIRDSARRRTINVVYENDGALDFVSVDRRRLRQVLLNLLSNAVKFTPDGGSLGLAVRRDERSAVLIVWDTGIGIAKGDLSSLFKPFVQLDAELSRRHQGTGLGLALVERLVQLHGGAIEVESDAGLGSRFTIRLPNVAIEERPAAPTSRDEPTVTLTGLSLLVVDDQDMNLQHLRELLEARGAKVRTAMTGAAATNLIHEAPPDVLLMDIQMPDVDGLETIRRLRADKGVSSRLGIVALTALAMPGDREQCLRVGADEYLSKPAPIQRIAEAIVAVANARR